MRFAKHFLAIGLALAGPVATVGLGTVLVSPTAVQARSCGTGYYVNSRGRCVKRPIRSNSVPSDATAQCRDGTYSFSQSRRGTCSHHGGVARWL